MINPDYFNQIFKVSPLPGLVLHPGPDLKVLEANDAYCKATGIPQTALLGNNLIKILADNLDINIDSLHALQQSLTKILKDKLPHKTEQISFNIFNEHIDNFEIKFFQPENIPLLDEQNEVVYIIHTLTDITEKLLQLDSRQMDVANIDITAIEKGDQQSPPTFAHNEKTPEIEENRNAFANADRLYRYKINYESLINGTNDLMWSVDSKMNLITANRAYIERLTKLTGKAPVAGESVLHTELGAEINKTWRPIYQRALRGESFNFKDQAYNAEKKQIEYAQFSFSPILNRKYEVIGVACYGKDLTQETQSLITLETVWGELNKIMDYSPDVICTIDGEGKFINVSAAAEKLWGYEKESMIGFNYASLVIPEDMELTKIAGNQILLGRIVTNFENRCVRKDGTLVPVIWSAKWDEADGVMYCVAKDGTEKKKAELEMNLLIRNTDESFILLDKELNIVDFNNQFKKLYENLFKLEVKKESSILIYAAPERRENLKKLYKKVLGGHEETSEISVQIDEKTKKFYFLKYKPALDENNDIIGVFVTGKDVTEIVMARQQIEVSEEKYRLLFNKSPIPKWVYDIDTLDILDVNETAVTHYGYSREEFLNMKVDDLKSAGDLSKVKELHQEIKLQEGLIHFGIFTQIKKDQSGIKADVYGHKFSFMKRNCMMIESNDVTEKESVLQRLKENEAKLLSAQKIARLGYWQKLPEPDGLFWSSEVYNIWGVSSENFKVGFEAFLNTVHPDDKEIFLNERAAALSGEKELNFEHRIILPNQSIKWVHEKGSLVKDDSGKILGFEGTVQDITENKLAREKLLLSEARHRGIVDSQTNYVIRTDINGNFTYGNNKFINDFGWMFPGNNIIGSSSLTSVCDHHKERVKKIVAQSFANLNKVFQVEIDKNRKYGGVITSLWDFICLSDSAGKPTEIQCVGINISDRKKAEKALEESNTRYEYVSKATSDAIWDWDLQSDIIYQGEGFKTLFGYEPRKLAGGLSSLEKNFHPNDKETVVKNLNKCLEGNETLWQYEFRYAKKDGTYAHVLDKALIIRNEKGRAVKMVGAMKDITETKTLQELLNKSNRLARIGSWEIDALKGTVYWSDVTKEIREADPDFEPDLGMGMEYFKEGKYRDTIKARVKQCLENGTPWDEELQITTQKGNLKWIRTIGEAEMVSGKCIKIYGSFQDIDEKKRAEIAVLRLYEEKNTILESIGDGFFTVDNNWIVTYWNHLAETMLSMPKNKILGHSLWDIFSGSINSIAYKNYHKALETREVIRFENHYAPLDKWYEISAYPSASGLSVYFKDISDRKKSQDAVRLSNELYTMVSKATNDSVWDWDLKTNRVSRPGKTLESLFGYEPVAAPDVDDFWKTHVHPDDWKRITEKRNVLLKNPTENYWEDEYRFLKPDGKFALIYDRAYIIRNEENEAVRMIGASQDFTKLRENEIQLKDLNEKLQKRARELSNSNAELEQFAYIASHDLQEPLRMVTSFLNLLEKKYSETIDEKGKQYIYFAVDGAKRMRQMILDLLEYSRMGRAGQTKEKIDVNSLVNEILILYRQTIQEKKAHIIINNLPVITASMAPTRQIFQNLIGNALKYHNNDFVAPEIIISCRSLKRHWEFSVKDNGIGIDEQYFEKIFVIFQRLHNKEEYSGTGMGLAIAKKIIESMGGKIWLTSEQGKGSTFFFSILKDE